MSHGDCLDDLIECVRRVLRREPEGTHPLPCKEKCLDCLTRLMGPEHYYTLNFRDFLTHSHPATLLAAVGVLTAAREEVAKRGPDQECPLAPDRSSCDLTTGAKGPSA